MVKLRLPDWSSILMVCSPGIGALEFNISMAKNYIDEGHPVVFIVADVGIDDVISLMGKFGIKTDELIGKTLFLIDYHSSLLCSVGDRGHQRADVKYVVDLEGIMFAVDSVAKEIDKPLKIFLYSLSTLFLYNQENVVLKFFQISSSKIRSEYGSAIFTLHDGVHRDNIVNHLMAIADGVIELKFDENLKRHIRIRHMRGYVTSPHWIPFEIRQIQPVEERPLIEF